MKLAGKAKEVTTGSAQAITKIKDQSSQIIDKIKETDYRESAAKVGKRFLWLRRRTISFYKRPFRDISHISLIAIIILTLVIGVSAGFGTSEQIKVNPFSTGSAAQKTQIYLSSTEKKILESDSVAAVASIYSDNLGIDAADMTDQLYKKADIVSGGDNYLSSQAILTTTDSGTAKNNATNYVVQNGDTLSGLAVKFGITTDTIRYANNLDDVDSIKPGQTLVILPSSGVLYTVASGDTLAAIANRFGADQNMIVNQNDLYGEDLKPGMKLMIVDANIPDAPKKEDTTQTQVASNSSSSSRSTSSAPAYVATSSGPNHFPYGYCTWWVASKRYIPWSGNAWQWYGNAQAYGRAVGRTPAVGSVMVTWESGYGHVAYVESVSGSSFTISEMNYAGYGRVSSRTLTTSSVPLIGFIY